MSNLDRWHEVHDAYVTFFGDDHRPAAVSLADRESRPLGPGAVIPINPGGRVEYLAPANYSQIMYSMGVANRDMTRILLFGDK